MTDNKKPFQEQQILEEPEISQLSFQGSNQSQPEGSAATPERPASPGGKSKLKKQIKALEEKVEELKLSITSKDATIKNLEKDKKELEKKILQGFPYGIPLSNERYTKLIEKFINGSSYIKTVAEHRGWEIRMYSNIDDLYKTMNDFDSYENKIHPVSIIQLEDGGSFLVHVIPLYQFNSNLSARKRKNSIIVYFFYEKDKWQDREEKMIKIKRIFNSRLSYESEYCEDGFLMKEHSYNLKNSLIQIIRALEKVYNDNDLFEVKKYLNDYINDSAQWLRSWDTLSALYDQYLKEIEQGK